MYFFYGLFPIQHLIRAGVAKANQPFLAGGMVTGKINQGYSPLFTKFFEPAT
jgi:hypothetical protein